MSPSLSETVQIIGSSLASASADKFVFRFNEALTHLLSRFHIAPGSAVDTMGAHTGPIDSLVSLTQPAVPASTVIPADGLASAIYVCHTLDTASLRDAYERIAQFKALHKMPSTEPAMSTVTLGLVVAASTSESLDALGEQMRILNRAIPDTRKPDMVAVLSEGTLSYAARFLGDKDTNDFLPPAKDALKNCVPPIYLSLCATLTKTHAFNKLLAFLVGHLKFFAPNSEPLDMRSVREGVPDRGVIVCTYQYNLKGRLIEVVGIAPVLPQSFRIEDTNKTVLSTIYLYPWLDGNVIVAHGALPLEGLLIFLQRRIPFQIFRRVNDRQLSCVLPITGDDFAQMLARIRQRTNMTAHRDSMNFTVAKFADEGTSHPFVARLYFTPLTLRDFVLSDKAQIAKFDEVYSFIVNHLFELRSTAREIARIWREHEAKVTTGEIARYSGYIQVSESVQQPLNKEVKSLVTGIARVAKSMQKLAGIFGVDIGFLFQKAISFEAGVKRLESWDAPLGNYLRESRKWIEPVVLLRDAYEHETFELLRMNYFRTTGKGVRAEEPQVLKRPVTEFAKVTTSRLNRFVEELLVWSIARNLPSNVVISEIPIVGRNPEKVERFKLDFSGGNKWMITYSDDAFDQV